jgi:hypothetical protein
VGVFRVGVGELEAADAATGIHGEVFGELGSGVGFGGEEIPNSGLLGVVGRSWITTCWADAAILFFDQLFVAECFVGCVAPEVFADFLVRVFCDCLGEAVADGFDHDRAVIVAGVFKFIGERIC